MSPTSLASEKLRQQIFYHIDNELLDTANFLAGRLHALEPRNADSAHLLALTYFRLRRYKAAFDFAAKYGSNGRHLGCTYIYAQACLALGGETLAMGAGALEKAKGLWQGRSNWNKHSETTRRHLPDAPAVHTLLAKLWQAAGDSKRAADAYVEAHKANPFTWDAVEGLCRIGADLNPSNMFKPTPEMGSPPFTSSAGAPQIYQDEVGAQATSHSLPTDPFSGATRPGIGQAPTTLTSKSKHQPTNGLKQPVSDWDSPAPNGNVANEDAVMAGSHAEYDLHGPQPPPAPLRKTRLGNQFESLDRPRPPALRNHASSFDEAHEMPAPRKALVGGQKRTISGQAATLSSAADPSAPRRSNRLFGQATTARSTRTTADLSRLDSSSRPAKPATGAKGRIGSTVGRVVSGNRKIMPPNPNEKEREKHVASRQGLLVPGVTSAAIKQAPKMIPAVSDQQEEYKAVNALLDSFRELAVGTHATSVYDLPEAIRTFRALPSAQRDTPYVLAQMGKAYYEASDYAAAEECFARVVKMQPTRTEDMEVYSTVLWHLKKDTTLAYLCHVLREHDWNAAQTWVALGNAFSLAREHNQAIAAFKRATQVDERFAYAWTLMGHEYIVNEEFEAALASFRKSVAVDRRGYGGWYGLGKTYERLGKLEEAERHYRIATSINPSNATLLVATGAVLERMRNKKAALANYTKALELSPSSTLARFKRARVLLHLRCHAEALQELEILRDQAPDEANVWFLLGKCYKATGDKTEALRALTTALNLDVKAAPFIKEAIETLDEEDEDSDDD